MQTNRSNAWRWLPLVFVCGFGATVGSLPLMSVGPLADTANIHFGLFAALPVALVITVMGAVLFRVASLGRGLVAFGVAIGIIVVVGRPFDVMRVGPLVILLFVLTAGSFGYVTGQLVWWVFLRRRRSAMIPAGLAGSAVSLLAAFSYVRAVSRVPRPPAESDVLALAFLASIGLAPFLASMFSVAYLGRATRPRDARASET